jgi:Icc-related predicted phosphoesterase
MVPEPNDSRLRGVREGMISVVLKLHRWYRREVTASRPVEPPAQDSAWEVGFAVSGLGPGPARGQAPHHRDRACSHGQWGYNPDSEEGRLTRLVYTSDLHGDLELYRTAGEAALRRNADALVFGGDLCPGAPSASTVSLPRAQPEFLRREVGPLVKSWKKQRTTFRVFAIPGNDDCGTILAPLDDLESAGLVENLHLKSVRLGDYSLVGMAFVPPTPFSFKDFERRDGCHDKPPEAQLARSVIATEQGFKVIDDFSSYLASLPTLEEEIARLPSGEVDRTIAVMHCPPYGTRCDVLFNGEHIGSRAIRRWIERTQPLLTLHGHIHESPKMSGSFVDRLGRTVVVNPGASGRVPHWVYLELESLSELEHSVYGRKKM